jgi:energy-coupling factor transporter ATP-binding protein EcfA2
MADGQSLLEWTDKQPPWARDALRRHAASPAFDLSEADKAAILERVRHAAGIVSDTELHHLPLTAEHLQFGSTTGPRALLCSLGPVAHLGRLAPGQQLRFATNGITLIYGDNGSGKSGYCRITKKICRSLAAEDLLGNVFEPADKLPAEVLVRYRPEGTKEVIEEKWTDGTPPPGAVRNISVFDSRNARLYVDKQNRVGFLPAGISLLERHGAHRTEMDGIFQREKKVLEAQIKVALPSGYTPNGKVARIIARLDAKVKNLPTEAETTLLAAATQQDDEQFAALERALAQDPAAQAGRRQRAAAVLTSYIAMLSDIETRLSEKAAGDLNDKVIVAAGTAKAAALAAEDTFAGEPLPDVGKDSWRLMYDYATAYVTAIGRGDELPSEEGDLCALCQQPLTAEASQRLSRFRKFVAGEAAKAEVNAKEALEQALANLRAAAVPTKTGVEQALGEYCSINAERAGLGAQIVSYMAAAAIRKAGLLAATISGDFTNVAPLAASLRAAATEDVEALNREATTYKDQAKLDTKRADDVARLNELKDKQWLRDALQTVLARRACLERYGKLVECSKIVGTQQLSTLMTSIRRKLVTEGLEQRIQAEVNSLDLGYLPLAVHDESRDGHSYFEVSLNAPVSVANDKVLSEGEQRALALASFLAEVAADTALNGLVIDDPVSSLDHLRIRRVAARLVAESAKGKQVIIFTHNLLFYNEVLDAAAAASPQVAVIKRIITKLDTEMFGIVSETDEPWIAQKVTSRIARLQQQRKDLESFKDFGTDEYRRAVKAFYADLRETWERLVEELLLGGVVERFNSGVKTQSLKNVTVGDEDYRTVYWAMKRASEWSGHDMAAAKNFPTPTPTDIKADLDTIDSYRTALIKRRNEMAKKRESMEGPPAAEVV